MNKGCYKMSMEDYLKDPCDTPSLSRSTIVDLLDSPKRAYYNHPRLNPTLKVDFNPKFDIGTADHDLLFEGGKNIVIVDGFDNWKKAAAQKAREEANAEGKTALLRKEYEIIEEKTEAARRQIRECTELGIDDLSLDGDAELTYIWQEKGVWLRIRPDWISKDRTLILDKKNTATSVNPLVYSNHIAKMGYPIQWSLYRRGVNVVEGTRPDFVFMAQENTPPYLCSFHSLDLMLADMADQKVDAGIKIWRKCIKTGKWPGYPNRVCYAEGKPWDFAEWEIKKSQMEEVA